MTYVYCGLLDHLYCDRSVICRLSGEDTELNQPVCLVPEHLDLKLSWV